MVNKKIVIIAIVIIIAIVGIGAYIFASGVFDEKIPDFVVDEKEIEVNETKTLSKSNEDQILSIQGVNFTVPKGLKVDLSYQGGLPQAVLFDGKAISSSDKYVQIFSAGEGNAKDKAQERVDQLPGSSIGNITFTEGISAGNYEIVYINEGNNIVSTNCYIQIDGKVFNVIYYGIELEDFFEV